MDLLVAPHGWLSGPEGRMRCALGPAGIVPAAEKREGDGATPAGSWPLRRVLYRPDRIAMPVLHLPSAPIAKDDGWCEVPEDPNYNRPVKLPYPATSESLWRADHLYDICIVLGHNDDPVVPGLGSAIFFHLAHDDYRPTQGCVAIGRADMLRLLPRLEPGCRMVIG